jgi:hypothetical protein
VSETRTWTAFELETGQDIQWKQGEETYGDFVARKNEVRELRRRIAESQRRRDMAVRALPWGDYSHFATLDEDEEVFAEVSCMRCIRDPKSSSTVIETHQADMDKIVEAMLQHEYLKHEGLPHG